MTRSRSRVEDSESGDKKEEDDAKPLSPTEKQRIRVRTNHPAHIPGNVLDKLMDSQTSDLHSDLATTDCTNGDTLVPSYYMPAICLILGAGACADRRLIYRALD